MNKVWKTVLITLASVILLLVLLVGAGIWWGISTINHISQEIYGGPLPPSLTPVVALEIENYKFSMLADKTYGNSLILVLGPKSPGKVPFSTNQVDQEIKDYAKTNAELDQLLQKLNTALPAGFGINHQLVRTLQFESKPGLMSEAGTLNLDSGQLFFVVTGSFAQGDSAQTKRLIESIPRVLSDSHVNKISTENPKPIFRSYTTIRQK